MRRGTIWMCLLLLACLVEVPGASADAIVSDWIGDYTMNHDGHRGTLRIRDSKADCAQPAWCALSISYVNEAGAQFSGAIKTIDQSGQHMEFMLDFPGYKQPFQAWIFSWGKNYMAGTTVWGGRTFGFFASKGGTQTGSAPQSTRTLQSDGSVREVEPDGTIVITYAGGGKSVTGPDGVTRRSALATVPRAVPPDPPAGSDLSKWLIEQNEAILSAIGFTVADAPTVQEFVAHEAAGSPFEKARLRLRTLNYLLAP